MEVFGLSLWRYYSEKRKTVQSFYCRTPLRVLMDLHYYQEGGKEKNKLENKVF